MKRIPAGFLLACLIFPVLTPAVGSNAKIAPAARDGERAAVIALLRTEPENVNAKLPDGTSALHWAVRSDDLELVSLLVHAKADLNAADPHGITPLALACGNANVAIMRARLEIKDADSLEKLRSTPDRDGTLLDHSLILYDSSMSNGNQHDHLPVAVAGGASGKLRGDRHIVTPLHTPMSNLLLPILEKLGIEQSSFVASTGKLEI